MSARDFTPPWDRVYLALEAYLTTWQEKDNSEASELAYVLADVAQTSYESEEDPKREDYVLSEDTLTKVLEKAWQDLYRERKRVENLSENLRDALEDLDRESERAHALQDRIDRIQEVLGEIPDE